MKPRVWHATAFSALLLATLAVLRRLNPRQAGTALVLLVTLDLGLAARFAIPTADVGAEKPAPELVEQLRVSPARVVGSSLPVIPLLDGVSPFESYVRVRGAFGDLSWSIYREYTALDLEAMGVNPVQAMIKAGLPKLESDEVLRVWQRLGAARFLSDRDEKETALAGTTTAQGRKLRVYAIPDPRPYVAIYPSWKAWSATSSSALSALAERASDREAVIWASGAPGPGPDSRDCEPRLTGAPTTITHDFTGSVESPCDSLVVLQELRFPRWRASIDGESAPVLDAEAGFVGVIVPKGRHAVRIYYDSLLLRCLPYSLVAFLVSALLTGLGFASELRRRRVR